MIDRLLSGSLWVATLSINGFVAIYGGAWLGTLLAGQPKMGAALGLGNLLAAVIWRVKEKPSLGQRVRAFVKDASPYSSIMVCMVVFSLTETALFFLWFTLTRWLIGGL